MQTRRPYRLKFRAAACSRAGALGLSLALHALLVTAAGLNRQDPVPVGPFPVRLIYADIEPRVTGPNKVPRRRPDAQVWRDGVPSPGSEPRKSRLRRDALERPAEPLVEDIQKGPSDQAVTRFGRDWTVRAPTVRDRMASALANGSLACSLEWEQLSSLARDACAARLAMSVEPLRSPADRRFTGAGERALATYDERRASLSPSERPTCEPRGPITDCEAEVRVKLFSSRGGFLPGLRTR